LSDKKKQIEALQELAKKYNQELLEIESDTLSINNLQFKRDTLLCQLIEASEPPFYLKHEYFNYKALLLYFMKTFHGNLDIEASTFHSEEIQKKLFNHQEKIIIQTPINSLFHLINIPKDKIKESHEKMIYDRLEFKNYGKSNNHFNSKIASMGWLNETLLKPDLIYDISAKKSKKIKFDFLFVKETGSGTDSQRYMYHVVALKDIKYNRFSILSQFPLEKDRKRSKGNNKVSMLHTHVVCSNPIFRREGIDIPKDGISIDNLRDLFGGR